MSGWLKAGVEGILRAVREGDPELLPLGRDGVPRIVELHEVRAAVRGNGGRPQHAAGVAISGSVFQSRT